MLDARLIGRIQGMFSTLQNKSEVARRVGCDRRTVTKYLALGDRANQYKYTRKESAEVKKRRQVIAKLVKVMIKKDGRTWPAYGSPRALQRVLPSHGVRPVSRRLVASDLSAMGLKSYVRPTTPTRRVCDLERRRAFARRELRRNHRRLVFTDESWISCNETTGKRQIAKNRAQVVPREKKSRWNLPCAMIWAAIGYNYKGPLVVFPTQRTGTEQRCFRLDASGYRRRCLQRIVPEVRRRNLTLMHDGARSHAASSTMQYLRTKGVNVLEDFPPYSPDFNMIEPIWRILQERIGARCPTTLDELVQAAKIEWELLPQALINNFVDHFKSALKKCLRP